DGASTPDYSQFAGPAAEGTLASNTPSARLIPQAAPLVERLGGAGSAKVEDTDFQAYAAVQVWAEAVRRAGTLGLEPGLRRLRDDRFETVLGSIAFDRHGDIVGLNSFIWYAWKDGVAVPRDPSATSTN